MRPPNAPPGLPDHLVPALRGPAPAYIRTDMRFTLSLHCCADTLAKPHCPAPSLDRGPPQGVSLTQPTGTWREGLLVGALTPARRAKLSIKWRQNPEFPPYYESQKHEIGVVFERLGSNHPRLEVRHDK